MNVADVRAGLAATLEDLSINAYAYAPDAPNSPAAFIYPDPFKYHAVFSGGDDWLFCVRFLIASTNTEAGQDQLDALISPEGNSSAVAAIESDQTLGGVCTSVEVTDLRNYGVVSMPDSTRYLSAELVVSVLG